MNEELQKALASLLGKANDGIDTASDFLVAELPDVIQQLLMWHGVKSLVICSIGLILVLTIYKQVKFVLSLAESKPKDKDENWCYSYSSYNEKHRTTELCIVFHIVVGFIAVANVCFGLNMLNLTWLQIWIAPKVWLIEYAAKLAN